MSLNGAIQIGRTALTASQVGLQTAGNNLANATTPGYSRQVAYFSPASSQFLGNGITVGRGVTTDAIRRQVDAALQSRLYNGISDQASAQHRAGVFSAVESIVGELSDNDLSSEMSAFFNVWSERANLTKSSSSVVQQGDKLAAMIRRQRETLGELREQIDGQIGAAVSRADGLMSQIADLNRQISSAEVGGAEATTLRDQRDNAIAQLAELMDVNVVDRGREGVNVLVGSTPIVTGADSAGLTMRRETVDGELRVVVSTRERPVDLTPESGQIGSMLATRTTAVDEMTATLDRLSAQLIFQTNRLHSTGVNNPGLTAASGTLKVAPADRTLAINNPANRSFASLPFAARTGGFTVTVKNPSTGQTQTVRINVDLDGINASGLPGTGDDTTFEDIRASLDAIDGLSASFTPDGRLSIAADAGVEFAFSDDSSGVLAVAGVNSYFEGTDGSTIAVRQDLKDDPSKLMTGRMINGEFVENATALAMADLRSQKVSELGSVSIQDFWRDRVQANGIKTAAAISDAQATSDVKQSLENQRAAVSGVSIDEESINLLSYQRQYQGAAKLISVADQMMDTLMALV
jgi:flagellar hook-associated protein 1 FlgK